MGPDSHDDPLNRTFASNLEPLVTAGGARLWIDGDTHTVADYQLGATRVLANPRGYPMERVRGFDAALAVEV
jgi:hypothetical protein